MCRVSVWQEALRQVWGMPALDVQSEIFASREAAQQDLNVVRRHLYAGDQEAARPDPGRLRAVARAQAMWRELRTAVRSGPHLSFAGATLKDLGQLLGARLLGAPWPSVGFPNLGNTCYVNSVVQCLFHCEPIRQDLFRAQAPGLSYIGDRLREPRRPAALSISTQRKIVRHEHAQ